MITTLLKVYSTFCFSFTSIDQLRQSWYISVHLTQNLSFINVPIVASSSGENMIWTSARCVAKTHMNSNPDKIENLFCLVTERKKSFMYLIFENKSASE